jgi:predicted transposase YdaD
MLEALSLIPTTVGRERTKEGRKEGKREGRKERRKEGLHYSLCTHLLSKSTSIPNPIPTSLLPADLFGLP